MDAIVRCHCEACKCLIPGTMRQSTVQRALKLKGRIFCPSCNEAVKLHAAYLSSSTYAPPIEKSIRS